VLTPLLRSGSLIFVSVAHFGEPEISHRVLDFGNAIAADASPLLAVPAQRFKNRAATYW
jgi:hypothetical protein